MPEEQFVPVDLNPSRSPTQIAEPTQAPPAPVDEDLFAPLDLRSGPSFAGELEEIANESEPTSAPVAPVDEPTAPPPPPPAPAGPDVIDYADGSTLSTEKTTKGWRAVLNSGSGNPEVFYGKTKDEMWTNVAAAKMHATRHIRDLDRKIKLTVRPEPPQEAAPARPAPQVRPLSADEVTEVADQLKSNPSLAFDTYFQKRTGLTIDQLVGLANEGRQARQELEAESVVRVFKARHPDYAVVDDNYKLMLGWLSKYKLGRTLTDKNQYEVLADLYDRSLWTPENLDEAFEDLAHDRLLELETFAPSDEEEEENAQPVVPPQPAPPTPSPRIANVRVGQRAGLGIRTRETVSNPVPRSDTQRPPSDEELERMTDAEITAHFAAVRRYASQQARR